MFRGYDLRGVAHVDLTTEIVEAIGKAYGTFLKREWILQAVIGRDCRATSEEYSQSMIRGLNWAGIDTVDIGMTLVGTFYWSQYYLNRKWWVFVTASHNPPEYNGFKFANDFSETLVSDGMITLRKMVENDDFEKGDQVGKNEYMSVQSTYFDDIKKRLPITKRFRILVDPSCSTAGAIVPEMLREIGCEVIEKNCNIDPTFPLGTADPTENAVAQRVRSELLEVHADIWFTYDADGDRIGIVDDKGGIIWNDVLVAIFAMDVLHQHPQAKIMYNTLCSKVVEDTIHTYKGIPFMWRTGHSFLKKKNQEVKAAFIGELSWHFFFSADFYNHDDGIYSTFRLLSYLSRVNKSLSEVVAELPKYISSPEIKVGCPDDKKVSLIGSISERAKNDFPNAEVISDERAGDGVRLNLDDSMFVIRYSQNGPYLTIKFEAKTQEKYDFLKKYLLELLESRSEVDWGYWANVESLR